MQRALSGDFVLSQGLADAAWNFPDPQLFSFNDYPVANFPCASPTSSPFLLPNIPATPLSLSRLTSLDRGCSAMPGALPDTNLCPPALHTMKTQESLGPMPNFGMDILFPLPSPLGLLHSSQDSDTTIGSLSCSQSDGSGVMSPHSTFDQSSYLSWGTDSFDDSSSVDASIAPPTPQLTHYASVETCPSTCPSTSSDSECDFEQPSLDGQSDASPVDFDSQSLSDDVVIVPAPLTEDSPLCDVYKAVLASHSHEGRYGLYSKAERKAKIQYYREKRARARASHSKKVAYECRFNFAVERPRVGGRFTKKNEGDWSETDKLSLQRRLQAKEQRASKPKARMGRPNKSKTLDVPKPDASSVRPLPVANIKPAFFLLATTV